MPRMFPGAALIAICLSLSTLPLCAQQRPDLSGVWQLDLAQSRMIRGTPTVPGRDTEVLLAVREEEPAAELIHFDPSEGRRRMMDVVEATLIPLPAVP